ncbi:MAG: VOC family protein [Microscillaceae bacterium]|jgi:catechol 2,3-dioxygenase-like lactoylglutathione lyase family enzyme|nr:VOC family protein [Microscillaceae bacterium]
MKTWILWLGGLLFSGSLLAQNSLGIVKHNHLALQVKDIRISAKFYQDVLGLEAIEVPDDLKAIRAWFKLGADQQIHLLAGRKKAVNHDKNGSHYALFVESIDQAEQFLKAQNIQYHMQIRFDKVKQIYFADPDGYLIELNEQKKVNTHK